MQKLWSSNWSAYELLDFGNGKKLERFGDFTLIRPEQNAKAFSPQYPSLWASAHAEFLERDKIWKTHTSFPPSWPLRYKWSNIDIRFELKLTKFKHVGVFQEQAANWEAIAQFLQQRPPAKLLNLFAYTGGASLVGKACGADVVHVDSIKQVVSWARENMEASRLADIRWAVEDAFKFAAREQKRGNAYDCIILDPPTFGRGPKGERWQLDHKLESLLKSVAGILTEDGMAILNTYSGFEPKYVFALCQKTFPGKQIEAFDLGLSDKNGRFLSTGLVVKIS